MWTSRSAAIFCHISSLPGPDLIGTLGEPAYRFVDWLASCGISWWQVLPVGPTGYADSPYQSPSTFAGNPLLIETEPTAIKVTESTNIDYGRLHSEKTRRLHHLATRMQEVSDWDSFSIESGTDLGNRQGFEEFAEAEHQWLNQYCLFAALKDSFGQRPWWEWPSAYRFGDRQALESFGQTQGELVERHRIIQYLFDHQWRKLRAYCRERGVGLIGDLPLFVAHDSADVWANRELFLLDLDGQPQLVSGVPPDYFSPTGQRWGNPLYHWGMHSDSGYSWWTDRLTRILDLFDLVRIDHFRGLEAAWHIRASCPTAVEGEWRPGPGHELFQAVGKRLGPLAIIAEDLGVITPPVVKLRQSLGFPGMKVLQFGFGTEEVHCPDSVTAEVVVYTGTHDNNTSIGWFYDDATHSQRRRALRILKSNGLDFHWDMIAAAWRSAAPLAVAPLTDVLGLGGRSRMNTPATTQGNWSWRAMSSQLGPEVSAKLSQLTRDSRRRNT